MKPKLSKIIVLSIPIVLIALQGLTFSTSKVSFYAFYFDQGFQCPECGGTNVLEDFAKASTLLTQMQKEYGADKIEVKWLNVKEPEYSKLFHQFNLTRFPAIVANNQTVIVGKLITEENVRYVINEYLAGRTPGPLTEPFSTITISNVGLAYSLGFFSGFSPCLMAMLAFILTYATGTSQGLKSGISRTLIFAAGLIVAVLLVGMLFLVLEVSVASIFSFLSYFTWIVAGLMIVIGLNVLGILKLPISSKSFFQKLTWKFGFSFGGLFFLGFLFYFVKVHCAIPFFMILLTQLPTQANLLDVILFLIFGAGVVTPFLGIGIVSGGVPKLARQIREHRNIIHALSGVILIGYAIWLIVWMLIYPA